MSPKNGSARTAAAQAAFLAKFRDSTERSEYFRELARRKTGRLELAPDEAAALVEAYVLLRSIAERARRKLAAETPAEGSGGHE